jgi:CheY-like chemotaxis protein
MFVDYQLEDMIGLQVVEALKLQPLFQDGTTKFILVSGIEEDIAAFETFFSYRLKKPLKLQDFDAIMSLIFEKEPSEV